MKKSLFRSVLFTTSLILVALGTFAQCRSVAKKQCFPLLTPYIQNGQFNSARLAPGETAEMQMTFYAGQNYRLMLCAENVLGDVTFRVLDADKKELFNSKKAELKQWDFKVDETMQLFVLVEVPLSDAPTSKVITPEGCVSILVGFKKM